MSQRRYGTVLSYLSIFINILTGLLFTPYLVKSLGKAEYGLFTIVGSLIANLAILDLGLSDSVVRYVAKFRALSDRESEDNFLALVTVIYAGIAVLVTLVGIVLITQLPRIFHRTLSAQDLEAARLMLVILIANVAATMLFSAVSATLVAYESFILLRLLEIGSILLSTLAMVAALKMGYKAVAIVAVTASVNALVLFTKVVYAFFVLKIRLKFSKLDWGFTREVFKYSAAIFIVVIVEQIYWKLDGVILGAMVSTSVVAVYTIGMSFSKYFMSFSTAISKVLMPKVVRSVEQGATGVELTDLLISISRIQSIVLMPILAGLVVFGREFIHLWVGPDFAPAYFVMLVTVIPYSLDLMGNIRNQIMQAKGIYWYRSVTILVISLVNVVATIILIKMMGMVGAAISTGLGIFVGYLVVNYILKIKVGIDVTRYGRELFSGLLPAALVSAGVAVLLNFIPGSSWSLLGVKVLVFGAVYTVSVWYIGMRPLERQMIKELLPANRPKPA
jgi:O-antigen/teichoic acid export membrane protein